MNLPELIDAIDIYREYRNIYVQHVKATENIHSSGWKKCKHFEERPGVVAEDTRQNWKCEALEDYDKARRALESLGDIKDIL